MSLVLDLASLVTRILGIVHLQFLLGITQTQRVILALKFNLGGDVEYKCEAKFIGISKQSVG